MYIRKIKIKNYRNFNDFTMTFRKGLNVIIGSNNSGKTGLLYAIRLLSDPARITVHDFNKNNLLNYASIYNEEPPKIEIEYEIQHEISEDDTEDESIIKLVPFLGMNEIENSRTEESENALYTLVASVKMTFALESKATSDYREAIKGISSLDGFASVLENFLDRFYWTFINSTSETTADKKDVTGIFDIRFIEAERTSDDVYKETKREIDAFAKDQNNTLAIQQLKEKLAEDMKDLLKPALSAMSNLFENENNEIGLRNGNVSIFQNMRPTVSIADAYVTDVKDTKGDFVVPLGHNGLGYNNLINIYMLIKLKELQRGKDFRILCLEEPEAHLHPAMQYKLFKFLRKLDEEDQLNQQIFVTTHSSNISAVAGLDNMYMLDYDRTEKADCRQQSLEELFADKDHAKTNIIKLFDLINADAPSTDIEFAQKQLMRYFDPTLIGNIHLADKTKAKKLFDKLMSELPPTHKERGKKHLTKFLDVTRSDMLFADKIILVEGIAEKLLLPMFMEKCGCSYEDCHISIVEIGGKHFEHFIELFNGNAVVKKVLCITDRDFTWISETDDGEVRLALYSEYEALQPSHIEKLNMLFGDMQNFRIASQTLGGTTFEDELLLTNIDNYDSVMALLGLSVSKTIIEFVDKNGVDLSKWKDIILCKTKKIVSLAKQGIETAITTDSANANFYRKLFWGILFLAYTEGKKGDVALGILTDEKLADAIIVPPYIKEGLEWLAE